MTQVATADFIEQVSDTRAGADFTDVVEFWPAGADTADWPVMEVSKFAKTYRVGRTARGNREGFQWYARHFEDKDLTRCFGTKHEALRYARKVMGE